MPRPRIRETKYTKRKDRERELRAASYELDAQLGLPVSRTLWRADEDELILGRFDSMGPEALAQRLGRTRNAVVKRERQLRPSSLHPRRLWTPEEDALVLDNYPHRLDARQLAVQLGRSPQQVHSRISRLVKDGVFNPEDLLERKAEVAAKSRREV